MSGDSLKDSDDELAFGNFAQDQDIQPEDYLNEKAFFGSDTRAVLRLMAKRNMIK